MSVELNCPQRSVIHVDRALDITLREMQRVSERDVGQIETTGNPGAPDTQPTRIDEEIPTG